MCSASLADPAFLSTQYLLEHAFSFLGIVVTVAEQLVRRQLNRVSSKLGSRKQMAAKCGLKLGTVKSWFRGEPRVPKTELRGLMEWSLIGRVQLMGEVQGRLMMRAADRGEPLSTIRALMMLNKDHQGGENEPWNGELWNEDLNELWNEELEDLWDSLVDHSADHFERIAAWDAE